MSRQVVIADAGDDAGVGAERARVIGEVRRSAAQLRPGGQQVPQHFADAEDPEAHAGSGSMPSRLCICSSGTPLVSGTMVFTQTSCSTIMPQKNRKT